MGASSWVGVGCTGAGQTPGGSPTPPGRAGCTLRIWWEDKPERAWGLPARQESDCGQGARTSHSGAGVSGELLKGPGGNPQPGPEPEPRDSLVLEAVDAGVEDLVVPLDGFDLVVGHAGEGVDDVRAETRVHIVGHVAGDPRAVLAPVGEVAHDFGRCAWNGRSKRRTLP